jgi:hypothetical protein
MKEFIFEDKTEDIVELIGFPPIQKCYVVINAELGTTYSSGVALSSYPRLSSSPNSSRVRDELLKDAFVDGVKKAL